VTLRQFVVMMEASRRRWAGLHNELAWLAFTNAVLAREKKLTKATLEKLLIKEPVLLKRRMTQAELKAAVMFMATAFRGPQ
jgi:hypothetical protein